MSATEEVQTCPSRTWRCCTTTNAASCWPSGISAAGRTGQQRGSAMGAHYRHTTPEMAARVITAIEARLAVVLSVAEEALETRRTRSFTSMF